MILVDTSVFIHYFHNHSTPGTAYLDLLIQQNLTFGISEYIYQELLQGARDDKEFVTLREYLSELPIYSLRFGIQSFENAARINFRCRRKGITIRSTVDLLIAETAIENDLILLHDDQDYVNMGKAIPELHLY